MYILQISSTLSRESLYYSSTSSNYTNNTMNADEMKTMLEDFLVSVETNLDKILDEMLAEHLKSMEKILDEKINKYLEPKNKTRTILKSRSQRM